MNNNLEFNWLINDFCNFNCAYCYPGSKKNKFAGFKEITKITEGFNKTGKNCFIYISGGEPFLHPKFVDLCLKLTENHAISINSNLTHNDIYRFANELNPKKVRCVHCSLHLPEREKKGLVQDFIKKYKYLEEKGFYIFSSYVLYPTLLKRFDNDYNYLKSKGIIVRPKIFRGDYQKYKFMPSSILKKFGIDLNKHYPEAYTKAQKDKISLFITRSQKDGEFNISHDKDKFDGRLSDVWLDNHFIDGLPCFKGRLCAAGNAFVRMTPQGDVYRCYNDELFLGNLFEKDIQLLDTPTPCRANKCSCPYIGYRYLIDNPSAGN